MVQDLKGKWVLLTGAASGIGKETCLLLATEGCNFVLADIDEGGLETLAGELRSLGSEVVFKKTDVTDREQISALASEVKERIGSVDILVNNAGIGCSAELKDTSDETWERLLELNFLSVIHMVNEFLPSMIEKGGGQIVNMSTGQVFYPVPTWGAYAASKAALATYSECLTWELKHLGIRVTTVFPGLISTAFYDVVEPRNFAQKFVLWWIRSLGSTPDKMAAKIVNGIKKQKRRVIQSWINWLTYFGKRFAPPPYELVGEIFAKALCE
jgi:short-subunit dehydrogenase